MSAQHGFTAAENLDIRRYFGLMLDVLTDREDPPPRNELKAAMFRALAEYDDLNDDALWRVADELDPPEPETPADPVAVLVSAFEHASVVWQEAAQRLAERSNNGMETTT
ncbi:MAG: hypothetical protein R2754_00140 [Microthrixaceae bacterium]